MVPKQGICYCAPSLRQYKDFIENTATNSGWQWMRHILLPLLIFWHSAHTQIHVQLSITQSAYLTSYFDTVCTQESSMCISVWWWVSFGTFEYPSSVWWYIGLIWYSPNTEVMFSKQLNIPSPLFRYHHCLSQDLKAPQWFSQDTSWLGFIPSKIIFSLFPLNILQNCKVVPDWYGYRLVPHQAKE